MDRIGIDSPDLLTLTLFRVVKLMDNILNVFQINLLHRNIKLMFLLL